MKNKEEYTINSLKNVLERIIKDDDKNYEYQNYLPFFENFIKSKSFQLMNYKQREIYFTLLNLIYRLKRKTDGVEADMLGEAPKLFKEIPHLE